MVTIRLSLDQTESSDWYDVNGDGIDTNGDSGENNSVGGGDTNGDSGENDSVGGGDIVGDSSVNNNVGGGDIVGDIVGDSGEINSGSDESNRVRNSIPMSQHNEIVAPADDFSDPDPNNPVTIAQQAASLQVRTEIVENRWQHLYDVENFFRLQSAIVNELQTINWIFLNNHYKYNYLL
jgi:hypothetical protein